MVESTTLLDLEDTAGVHLFYVMNYLHRSEPAFSRPEETILDEYQAGLQRLFPELRPEDFIDRFLFRSPFVEPLYTTGYLQRQPPQVLWPHRVYLANTTQVYPEVTSWNGAVGGIERLIERIQSGG